MKFPNHLILDTNDYSVINKNQHWSAYYISNFKTNNPLLVSIYNDDCTFRKNNVLVQRLTPFKSISNKSFLKKIHQNNFWLSSSPYRMFNINFLRKERLYTKLKYSRVPQYDIVSGGVAALFAGFLGFLICEKFGFELIDSGDFYFLFMYLVFVCFFANLFSKILSKTGQVGGVLSLKWLSLYARTVLGLLRDFSFYPLNS